MYLFAEKLRAPVVGIPTVNHDNNQHAANENLRLQNLWDGIETCAALLARLNVTHATAAGMVIGLAVLARAVVAARKAGPVATRETGIGSRRSPFPFTYGRLDC